ncbi:MAG TPA: Ig-like domain-containing protein, partial [Mariniphaga sp.]|nr:Ig-like domain-containing protein [Mariniphaga sp.]
LTITPTRGFFASGRYEFVVTFGAVSDLDGNRASVFTRTFNADEEGPVVEDYQPEFTFTEANDSASAVFKITYNENIVIDSLIIVTHESDGEDWLEYEVLADDQVTIEDNVLTITPGRKFAAIKRYELIIAFSSVFDASGNPAASFTRVFVPDSEVPDVENLNVEFADTKDPDSVSATFTLTYNENVMLYDDFKIATHVKSPQGWVEYELFVDSNVVVSENTVTITPALPFLRTGSYELVVASGAFLDRAANRSPAYTSVFLRDSVPPVVVDIQPDITDSVPVNAPFVFTFSEEVRLANDFGFYTYRFDSTLMDFVEYEKLEAGEAEVDSNKITFTPSEAFTPDRRVQIILTAGSVMDIEGNTFRYVENDDSLTYVSVRFWTTAAEVINEVAIAEIHGEEETSPLVDQKVIITGTITGIYEGEGFYVQDDNAERSGIFVEYADALEIELGEGVTVTGVVSQVEDEAAVLVAHEVEAAEASVAIEPMVIDFGNDSIPLFRGVLVQIENGRGTVADEEGEWWLYAEEDADSIIVSDQMFAYTSVADNSYNVVGIVTDRDGIFRIEPRIEADVVDVTIPSNVDVLPELDLYVYPNPFRGNIKLNNHDKIDRLIISNIAGQRVLDVSYPNAEINTSHLVSGVYIISLFKDEQLVKTNRIVKQ